MTEPAALVLARWAAGLDFAALPAPVVDAARRHLVDAVGCAVAGIRRDAAGPALVVAEGLGGPPEARLFTGQRVGAVAAAYGNAVAVHALDYDDTHADGLVHASAVSVPPALAVGEQTGSRGSDLITALVAGLEVVCRLGAAVPHGFHARGLHATSMCGPVAAAVTAGKLLGLSTAELAHAIGIAASGASGLLEFLHSPAGTKQLHPGTAVANGILAARLAAAGATGPAGALDGSFGLFRALTGREPDMSVLVCGLGERWETTRIAVKLYPACQLVHASIDAARTFAHNSSFSTASSPCAPASETGAQAGNAALAGTVVVTLHPDAVPIVAGTEKRRPRSPYEAKFSVYWCVAAAIVDGRIGLDTFDRLDRPDVLALANRIVVRVGASDGPAASAPGIVTAAGRQSIVPAPGAPASVLPAGSPLLSAGVGAAAARDIRAKAIANLGPAAEGVLTAVDSGASPADLLDAIERCLK
ncbi:MmgE/PrpD family protein [Actinoplanes sp. HUAS TT8]|uniref:MmgE/PrpD family protein n=1 Tax=Actinoplanes sp. HUAS TT8 TaxID=3447453 RepID=UPI003F520F63